MILRIALVAVLATGLSRAVDKDTAVVDGRITTLSGFPLPQAKVSFYKLESPDIPLRTATLVRDVVTNEAGKYKVENLPWGQYHVLAELPGFPKAEVWRFYLWRDAERVLDIGLGMGILHGIEAMRLSGTVRTPAGKPVSDATVTLLASFDSRRAEQKRTNQSGRFMFQTLQGGEYVVYACVPQFIGSSVTVTLASGARKEVALVATPK